MASFSKRGPVFNHSYENEFNTHVNENVLLYERVSTRTRFEKKLEVIWKWAITNPDMLNKFWHIEVEENRFLRRTLSNRNIVSR